MSTPLTNAGPFGVHLTDPPWQAKDQLPGPGRGAAKKYDVMSTAAICAMHTPIMKPDAVLFLWRIGAMVPDAYRVAQAWGFEGKAEMVWLKMERCGPCKGTGKRSKGRGALLVMVDCDACDGKGEHPHFGMGHHVRYRHESCIIATRGSPKRLAANIPSDFAARMPVDASGAPLHSAKPPEFYEIVERLYPGPYVETFARTTRPGWVSLGNQVPEVMRGRR